MGNTCGQDDGLRPTIERFMIASGTCNTRHYPGVLIRGLRLPREVTPQSYLLLEITKILEIKKLLQIQRRAEMKKSESGDRLGIMGLGDGSWFRPLC